MGEAIQDVEVVIVGGGPAGLSAALCLGRSRKQVVVLDAGSPRHAAAEGVHNFLSRDGMPPAELRRVAWDQMSAYPSVKRVAGRRVEHLSWQSERWLAEDDHGGGWRARAVLLATGVIDEHPDIRGLRQRWGHSIHQCPFCHGWEMQDQPLAVVGEAPGAVHLGMMLTGWSDDVAVLTNGGELDAAEQEALNERGVEVYRQPVAEFRGEGRSLDAIYFDDGSQLQRRGAFIVAPQRQVPLVDALDVELSDEGYIRVDEQMRTSLPMLWAAGDSTSRMQQVVAAAAQGQRAGALNSATLTMGGLRIG